jgi:DNA mismatch repair protein MutL
MSDIIQILPDSVANQIAAGEVIQRPASVVKELVENAVDSGATNIKVVVKDAGKTLIQVIDNGSGMSDTDARLAFERHATSKIRKADDLFAIETFGFRGEALASIAAIAQVELRSCKKGEELGTLIRINGSDFETQEAISCQQGSIFSVKNLFYNVPARRRFLKADAAEFRHILDEFHRVALAHPEIAFSLIHNDTEIYNLPVSPLKPRILNLFGKALSGELLPLNVETTVISAEGFIGKPENARKKSGLQFFFVNNRYMRHPFLYRTLLNSYQNLLPPDSNPSYFIYFNTDPKFIDVNIHPTKTEIKFEDEKTVSQILSAAVRQTLGKTNMIPSLDFDNEPLFDIPPLRKGQDVIEPEIQINYDFNPFENEKSKSAASFSAPSKNLSGWQDLYKVVEQSDENQTNLFPDHEEKQREEIPSRQLMQFKGRYILVPVKSGLMVIDQKRAHERILFDEFERRLGDNNFSSQKLVYPKNIEMNVQDAAIFRDLLGDLQKLGYDIDEFGKNSFVIHGVPAGMVSQSPEESIENFIALYQSLDILPGENVQEKMFVALAETNAIASGKTLSQEEMQHLVDSLFGSQNPNYSPSGRSIFSIISTDDLEKRFK